LARTLPSCHGATDGSLTITVGGGNGNYTIIWSDGTSGATLSEIGAGTYEVTLTDQNACELETSFTLPEKEELTVALAAIDPLCFASGDGMITAQVSGGNGGYTYAWSTGATSDQLLDLDAGTYAVTVSDALGCTATASTTLTDPAQTTFTIDDIAICSGQQYKLTAPVDALSYAWSGPNDYRATSREVTISDPGTYTLAITDQINCPAESSFEVFIDDEILQADFLVSGRAYAGDTLIIIDISWPIPDTLRWEFPAGARVVTRTQDFLEVVFDEAGTYSCTMYCELGGCRDRKSVV